MHGARAQAHVCALGKTDRERVDRINQGVRIRVHRRGEQMRIGIHEGV